METGSRFIVSFDRLEKLGIETASPGEGHSHCAIEASTLRRNTKETCTIVIRWKEK